VRHHAKIDANQPEIVKALRSVGCSVQSLATVGKGCPDLLVGYRSVNLLMEVKDGSLAPARRRLTPLEDSWHALWKGRCYVVENVEQALAVVKTGLESLENLR